jgi:hypothetical protein
MAAKETGARGAATAWGGGPSGGGGGAGAPAAAAEPAAAASVAPAPPAPATPSDAGDDTGSTSAAAAAAPTNIAVFLRVRPAARPSPRLALEPADGAAEFNIPRDAGAGCAQGARGAGF